MPYYRRGDNPVRPRSTYKPIETRAAKIMAEPGTWFQWPAYSPRKALLQRLSLISEGFDVISDSRTGGLHTFVRFLPDAALENAEILE